MTTTSPGPPCHPHQLRIAGKWLRYTLEFAREALEPEATPLIRRVVALQDHLGAQHDLHVAATLARDVAAGPAALSNHEIAATGRFVRSLDDGVGRLGRTFGRTWRPLVAPDFRRRLGRAWPASDGRRVFRQHGPVAWAFTTHGSTAVKLRVAADAKFAHPLDRTGVPAGQPRALVLSADERKRVAAIQAGLPPPALPTTTRLDCRWCPTPAPIPRRECRLGPLPRPARAERRLPAVAFFAGVPTTINRLDLKAKSH